MKPTPVILIGAPVVGEEARFLVQLCSDLQDVPSLILANFEVGPKNNRRQIDFVVVTAQNAGLLELKNLQGPVFGSENGSWTLRDYSGQLVTYGGENPWHQASQAKLALSDGMKSFAQGVRDVPSPIKRSFFQQFDATVCIFPNLHPDSRVTRGDYKAWVRGYPDTLANIRNRSIPSSWGFSDWRKFATHLGLLSVRLEQAIDPNVAAAHNIVVEYSDRLRAAMSTIPPLDAEEGNDYGLELVKRLLEPRDVVLLGEKGCGKTLHALHAAISACDPSTQEVPIFIRAKRFRGGDLWTVMQQSIAPFSAVQLRPILDAIAKDGMRPLLIMDGLNECAEHLREDLWTGIRAFQTQNRARVIITTQPTDSGSLQGAAIVEMGDLTAEQKRGIYCYHAGLQPSTEIDYLCQAFTNAYDLTIAGRCHSDLQGNVNRASLYERYCRSNVPQNHLTVASALLRHLASKMGDTLSFVLARDLFEREAEQFLVEQDVSLGVLDELRLCRLIEVGEDWFSFEHELIFDYFRAEHLRRVCQDATVLCGQLMKPLYRSLLEFILPYYSDTAQIANLLASTPDSDVLLRVARGQCGEAARSVLIARTKQLLDEAAGDVANISLKCEPIEDAEGKRRAGWVSVDGSRGWTSHEALLCHLVELLLNEEQWQRRFLSLLTTTEHGLRDAAEEVSRVEDIPFRSVWGETVRCLGLLRGPHISLPAIEVVANFRNGVLRGRPGFTADLEGKLWSLARNNRSHFSQLMLIAAIRFSQSVDCDTFRELLRLCWNSGVYILRMEVMELARQLAHHLSETYPAQVAQVTAEIEKCLNKRAPMMNSLVLEALAGYDGYERPVGVQEALSEIREMIAGASLDLSDSSNTEPPDSLEGRKIVVDHAYSIIDNFFEDLFQGAYYEAYEMLDSDERFSLLYLAAQQDGIHFHSPWILHELLRLKDGRALPVYRRRAGAIEVNSFVPQECADVFVYCVMGCSQLCDEPPEYRGPDDSNHRAWATVGKIIFWDQKHALKPGLADQNIRSLWLQLHGDMTTAFPDVLYKLRGRLHPCGESPSRKLIRGYPDEIRLLLEVAIARPDELTSAFLNGWPSIRWETLKFAINTLAEVGAESSVPVLISLQNDPELGEAAVKAVRMIRSKKPH